MARQTSQAELDSLIPNAINNAMSQIHQKHVDLLDDIGKVPRPVEKR
jgi:hypothetical protein